MEFLAEYGLFLAKSVTIVIAFALIVVIIAAASMKGGSNEDGAITVKKLNQKFDDYSDSLREKVLDSAALKRWDKRDKDKKKREAKEAKQKAKSSDDSDEHKKRVFIVDFHGDIKASATTSLREEVTAILSLADDSDEVVVRLESQGGMVHSYGLAASQLARITQKNIPLTVCVDKVAASGGYMMACVAPNIIAAPFAIIGSIGVIAQLPNFHKILKKNDVDYEMYTAGEYKRTLTMFGENTDKGRKKFMEDLEDTHVLFKEFIREHREKVDLDDVATGEIWFGLRAIEKQLIDSIQTSDEYLFSQKDDADLFEVKFEKKKKIAEKLGLSVDVALEAVLTRWWQKLNNKIFT